MAYATDAAINHGKEWSGFKVVEGRSNRKYKDEDKVAEVAKRMVIRTYIEPVLLLLQKWKNSWVNKI